MKADSDRHCSIRGQVDAFADAGIKSDQWHLPIYYHDDPNNSVRVPAIRPEQWLADPNAARVAPGQEK
jgi:hypothetical protein